MNYSESKINELLQQIYDGIITVESLPIDLYNAVSKYLVSGLGKIEGTISAPMLKELTANLEIFSGCKVYHSIRELNLLKNENEFKSFKEYSQEAEKTFDQYYKQWARTEYDTTIAQAQMVERWEQIEEQKKTLPFLRYSAVIDDHTSEICEPLDGVTLAVNDPFWDTNTPLNHFNCRCTLEQLDEFDAELTDKSKADEISKEMGDRREPLFNSNPYKDKAIFDESHPYFDVPKDAEEPITKLLKDGK